MKRIAFAIVFAVAMVSGATAAGAASSQPYAPKNSLVFNNPYGSKAQKEAIITQVNRAIDSAPKGSTIRIAQYIFDIKSSGDKLIAAHKRGVNVKMLTDDNYLRGDKRSSQAKRLASALGTNPRARSFVVTCSHSCMSNDASVMHAKFFTFSTAGSSKLVSMISSANLYSGNTQGSWNNLHTFVGDTVMYSSLAQYFNDMMKDKTNPGYYRTTTTPNAKLYFFPRTVKSSDDIALLDVLNNVKCTGVAKGYGQNGKTIVRVAQWGWTTARLDIARRLWTLHDQGCVVQVITNGFTTNPKVISTLLKPSKKEGVMRIYDAHQKGIYTHHKVLLINGNWFGHGNTKVTYTGSQNFTGPGTKANNEILMRVNGAPTFDAYTANLNLIRDKYSKRITKAPVASPAQTDADARGDEDLSILG